MHLQFKRVGDHNLPLPYKATDGAAAFDVHAAVNIALNMNDEADIPLGFAVEIPQGYGGLLVPRSGLGTKYNFRLRNTVGVIDSDYRGEMVVCVKNGIADNLFIEQGNRIAQLWVLPVPDFEPVEVAYLSDTERGEGRMGHTGQ